MSALKILIVDDHEMIRDGLKSLLEDQELIESIKEAENGKIALRHLDNNEFDVIIMDISMPVMDGIEATQHIVKKFPAVKVLALTMHDEESHIVNMLQAGASGYILKKTGKSELLEALETVAAGESYFSREVSTVLMSKFMKKKIRDSAHQTDPFALLTKREIQVFEAYCRGKIRTRKIAEKVVH